MFALEEIFLCLDPKTAFAVFLRVSKQCNSIVQSSYLRSRYFEIVFGTRHDYEPGLKALQSLLSSMHQREAIPLTALVTTGGIDEDNMFWWVQNMFTPNHHSAYCSKDNKNNIMVAAVLTQLVVSPPDPALVDAYKSIAGLLRGNGRLRTIPDILPVESTEDLTEIELQIAVELYRVYPHALVPEQPEESELSDEDWIRSHLTPISNALSLVSKAGLSFKEISTRADDSYYLEKPHDPVSVSAGKTIYIASEVVVSREGRYTCPLETFMVFISEDWLSVETEDFSRFDNLLQVEDVVRLGLLNGPETLIRVETENTVYCEFKRTAAQLRPVLWGKFKTRQGTEINASLQQRFVGKYVYVKLINPENRMAEMQDMHDHTNIDCKFVGLNGCVRTIG